MQWTLKATIRCDALLGMGEVHISAPKGQQHECIRSLRLDRPREIGGRRSVVGSEFDLKLLLDVRSSEEARWLAPRCAREVADALSFLVSAAADVRGVSVTDAPDEPVPGTEYTTWSYPDVQSKVPPVVLSARDVAFLIFLKPERVVRALRWMQKSHFTDSPLDEFTCLMVAFESLSQLLKEGGTRYWHCSGCEQDVRECPLCGESTESKMSGVDAMREFVVGTLGWAEKDWRTTWQWRCKLFHGDADISDEEERAILPWLPKVEEALIAATKHVLGVPQSLVPARGRYRPPVHEAHLEIKHRRDV